MVDADETVTMATERKEYRRGNIAYREEEDTENVRVHGRRKNVTFIII